MATTTDRYLVYPNLGIAGAITSSTAAWTYGGTTGIVNASVITADFWVCGFCAVMPLPPAVNTTYAVSIALYYGASTTLFAELPWVWRMNTSAGHMGIIYIPLVEPFFVPANSKIDAAAKDSHTASLNYSSGQLHYITA
jgi:hypothetical protein